MISQYAYLRNLIRVLNTGNTFEGATLTMAYENDIKPYPVEKPIIAFLPKKITFGDRLTIVNEDGSETRTKARIGECVFKVTIFVPYESGAEACYHWATALYSHMMFDLEMKIRECQYHDCNYVRDCSAVVLETAFTMCETYDS